MGMEAPDFPEPDGETPADEPGPSGRSGRRGLLVSVLVLVGIPLFWGITLLVYALTPLHHAAGEVPVEVIIPADVGLAGISSRLAEAGMIAEPGSFTLLAALSGSGRRLQAGEYRFEPGLTPYELIRRLVHGKVLYRPVTVPEGADVFRIADIMEAGGWEKRERFLARTKDPDLIRGLGLEVDSLEGYLFPETYYFSRGRQTGAGIIRMMVTQGNKVYRELIESLPEKPELDRHSVLTLASIVEKETARQEERPLVAAVFLNRLARGMRLQADPTVIYGLREKLEGPLTARHLKQSSPYNTYLVHGLPPGPICNPGRAAILAVLKPAAVDYLYFVSRNDGSHHFSRTLAGHNRAVARYRDVDDKGGE